MIIDEFKVLAMQQVPFPGSVGDSMAESGRAKHLSIWRYNEFLDEVDLSVFRTEKGYVRHPSPAMPDDWKESDTSTDQCLPWYLGNSGVLLKTEMKQRIKNDGWRTGNGDFISPIFYAILKDNTFLISLFIFIQSLFFLIPVRWNDEKHIFESVENMSGDYLNFFHAGLYSSKWARVLVPKDKLKDRVRHYYKPEPNCEWLINMYDEVINSYW